MDYSHKDFTGRDLTSVTDLISGAVIQCSCFSQEIPDTIVFPTDMTGIIFISCNLDNCLIPAGNSVVNCSQRRYMAIDGVDMLVDANNNPLEPL